MAVPGRSRARGAGRARCCRSWGCPSIPRPSRPRCDRTKPQRASRRRPPLLGSEGQSKRLQKSRWCARSPLQLLAVPQAASSLELLLCRIVFLSRWGSGAAPRRRAGRSSAGGEATFVCQPALPPPPPPAARAISGNSS